ncbi:MAG: excinuclease ABC subunit UvrA [Patescibacteria group bacterium]
MDGFIKIRGARQHNLKNIDLDIPKNKLVVLTGVSGSGKSSLAFDTIYAEGQRRYVESLSTYARQFLGIMEKPDCDHIEGLSPAISIDQKTTSRNPRSTVGTVTEIYDYLRLLFARIGHPHCPICGREISHQTLDQIVSKSIEIITKETKKNSKGWFLILSPVVSDRKGEFSSLFDNLKAKGYKQVRVDGIIKDISEDFVLIKTNKHTIEAVVDRISGKGSELKSRLTEAVQQALNLSEGLVILAQILDSAFEIPEFPKKFQDTLFSEKFACPKDNIQIQEIEPRSFSFNSPHGACPKCSGLGKLLKVEKEVLFAGELSIMEGGIIPFSSLFEHETWYSKTFLKFCEENGINHKIPINQLTEQQMDPLESKIVVDLERRYKESTSEYVKAEIEKYMRETVCELCCGARLKKESLGVTVNGLSISEVTGKSILETVKWIKNLNLNIREKEVSKLIINEVLTRLNFLTSVGLEYITLGREAGTLSGGEAQRIRLASQIGSGLTGVLYVLDEPTIGLHQKDNQKLIDTLKKLRDLGNTVIVVEHDREMINQADHVIDFGPGAGDGGGKVVAQGKPSDIAKDKKSITGQFLCGKRKINITRTQKLLTEEKSINLYGCSQYNLKDIDVEFPLGKLVVITGVSGSGKSTLLVETLYPALFNYINPGYRGMIGKFRKLEGKEETDKVILIDQSPIGRTPRSNPATYTGLFDPIREVFSSLRESRAMGFKKGRFSFNLKGGRCEACEGQGQTRIEMQFMSDIWITCDICHGKRYNAQTLEIEFRGKNISDVLGLTVKDAIGFCHGHSLLLSKLETLDEVGLGYIKLGQLATTLSGGEAQRVKLATELSKKATGRTVYILDEPTTGLHFADVERLLKVLRMLVDRGNSIFLIEHNLDVIKNADYIIDLGPGGGDEGGKIIAKGTIKEVIKSKTSYTAKYL